MSSYPSKQRFHPLISGECSNKEHSLQHRSTKLVVLSTPRCLHRWLKGFSFIAVLDFLVTSIPPFFFMKCESRWGMHSHRVLLFHKLIEAINPRHRQLIIANFGAATGHENVCICCSISGSNPTHWVVPTEPNGPIWT